MLLSERQPGNRRRVRCAAWQPPKGTLRSKESRRLACETLGVGIFFGNFRWQKIPTPAQPTQARTPAFQASAAFTLPLKDACFLCFAERLRRWPGFAAGATNARNYRRQHNRRRRGRLLSRLRCGGDYGGNYYRLHNRRRRDACDTLGVGNIDVRKKLPTPAQPTQARRLRSLLCRAPDSDVHVGAVGRGIGILGAFSAAGCFL